MSSSCANCTRHPCAWTPHFYIHYDIQHVYNINKALGELHFKLGTRPNCLNVNKILIVFQMAFYMYLIYPLHMTRIFKVLQLQTKYKTRFDNHHFCIVNQIKETEEGQAQPITVVSQKLEATSQIMVERLVEQNVRPATLSLMNVER